jgi:predicted nucleotidyltransferase
LGAYDIVKKLPLERAKKKLLRPGQRKKVMNIKDLLQTKREEILRTAAKHGARNIRVFGSVARGEADEESDIDLLVEMEPSRSLLDHAALWLELQEVLGRKVDVVSDRGIKPRIRERVLREAVPL